MLLVNATLDTVSILDGINVVAKHIRSFDKGAQIKSETHIAALSARKKQARLHRGQHRLTHAVECGRDFLNAAAERGYPLRSTTNQLIDLLDDYGASVLSEAMADALTRGVPHPNAVRQSSPACFNSAKAVLAGIHAFNIRVLSRSAWGGR